MAVRIDKWLWAARFFKTRRLATDAVSGGHVQINGESIKPSKAIQIGDSIKIVKAQEQFEISVTGLAEKRGSATVAKTLYQETEDSLQAREEQKQLRKFNASSAPAPNKRPDKKARGKIIRFKRRED